MAVDSSSVLYRLWSNPGSLSRNTCIIEQVNICPQVRAESDVSRCNGNILNRLMHMIPDIFTGLLSSIGSKQNLFVFVLFTIVT